MINLHASDLRTFVPSQDFALSKDFYLGVADMEAPIRAFLEEFEAATGTRPKLPPSDMLAKYKRNRAT